MALFMLQISTKFISNPDAFYTPNQLLNPTNNIEKLVHILLTVWQHIIKCVLVSVSCLPRIYLVVSLSPTYSYILLQQKFNSVSLNKNPVCCSFIVRVYFTICLYLLLILFSSFFYRNFNSLFPLVLFLLLLVCFHNIFIIISVYSLLTFYFCLVARINFFPCSSLFLSLWLHYLHSLAVES